MPNPRPPLDPRALGAFWTRNECGRLTLSWGLAGGILAGGLLLLTASTAGEVSPAPAATLVLFVLGALAGLVHGAALAYLARSPGRGRREAVGSVGWALLAFLPLAPLAWFVALHVALTPPFWTRGLPAMGGVVLSWLVAAAVSGWAAWEGWTGLRRAFLRWPARRAGATLLSLVLAVLAVSFLRTQPTIWGTDLQVRGMGALILALGATVWIAFPVVLALLHGVHRLLGDRLLRRRL